MNERNDLREATLETYMNFKAHIPRMILALQITSARRVYAFSVVMLLVQLAVCSYLNMRLDEQFRPLLLWGHLTLQSLCFVVLWLFLARLDKAMRALLQPRPGHLQRMLREPIVMSDGSRSQESFAELMRRHFVAENGMLDFAKKVDQ